MQSCIVSTSRYILLLLLPLIRCSIRKEGNCQRKWRQVRRGTGSGGLSETFLIQFPRLPSFSLKIPCSTFHLTVFRFNVCYDCFVEREDLYEENISRGIVFLPLLSLSLDKRCMLYRMLLYIRKSREKFEKYKVISLLEGGWKFSSFINLIKIEKSRFSRIKD